MRKIARLTESDLNRIVKKVINENERVYGSENINSLYSDMGADEYVDLDDSSGDLSGKIVGKKDYIKRMLKDAIRTKDWEKVNNVIMFIDLKM